MHPSNSKESSPARRRLLGTMVSAAALLGLNAAGAAASEPAPESANTVPPEPKPALPEEPTRILLPLATEVETADAGELDSEAIFEFEQTLLRLSGAVADRYFLQGAHATPTKKLGGLA